MSRKPQLWRAGAALALLTAAATHSGAACADDVADFYNGRTVTIIVAAGPGGNHTKYSQYLAPLLEKHMPGNPKFVTQNMGGAGGTKAANYLYNSAPKDGGTIGILLSDTPIASRLRATGIKYEPQKFRYLGGAERTRTAYVVMKRAGVATIEDATRKQVLLGSTGKGSQTFTTPTVTNAILGTKFKVITGYRGMGGVYLAIERGEVDGFTSVWSSIRSLRPHWIEKKLINVLAAVSLDPIPDLPGVPLLVDMVKDPVDKGVISLIAGNGVLGRCWLAPPGVPADRLAALRTAFDKALNDPGAIAQAPARRMAWDPVTWQELEAQVAKIASADKAVIARMRSAMGLKK